jgi:uncharacterized membrane protein YfcA
MTLLAAALATVVGLALGLLGGGGAILTVPILVYVLGLTPKVAVPVSLVVVGLASAVGAAGHWRAGRLIPGEGMRFAGFAMAGAFFGARAGLLLPDRVQLGIFAGVVLVAAVAMWRSVGRAVPMGPAHPAWHVSAAGAGVGALTGLVGIGGGFLFVPALVSMLRYPVAKATAVSLLVIALNAAAALVGYGPSLALPWPIVLPFLGCVIVGLLVGQSLAPRVGADTLKRSFALLLLAVGAFVLIQNLR